MSEAAATRRARNPVWLASIVARRDYLRTVRRKGFIFGTLLLPLALGFFLVLSSFASGIGIAGGGVPTPGQFVLLVANESGLELQADPELTPHAQLISRDEGLARLAQGSAQELYVIPVSYLEDGRILRIDRSAGSGSPLGTISRQSEQLQELGLLIQSGLLADSDVPAPVATRLLNPVAEIRTEAVGGGSPPEPSITSFLAPLAITMLFVVSIFITTGYLLQSVTEEKENRVVEIVLSSVPALPLMAGKIVGLGAAGLTQVAIWVLTALLAAPLLGTRVGDLSASGLEPGTLILAILYFGLGYLAYGAMFSAVGAVAPGSREAQQYAGIFGFVAVVPLIFSGLFLTDIGSPIVTALALIPVTAPATMLMVLTLAPDTPWLLVVGSLISLSVFAILATVASARVFRATLLLYGVRPSVQRIARAILTG